LGEKFTMKKFIPLMMVLLIGVLVIPSAHADQSNKYVIFTFDDTPIGQYNFGKPILDSYGYKGSFMVVCNWVGGQPRMSWTQIADLKNDGMDIGSHTMSHPNLNQLSASQLEFELAGSKQCLQNHGITPTTFSYPRNMGSENATVVNMVSKYYSTAKSLGQGSQPFTFLSCQGYNSPRNQTDCATITPSGKLQYTNIYGIRMLSIDDIEQRNLYNDSASFDSFVQWIDNQTKFNMNGQVVAIPVVTIHEIISPASSSFWLHTNQLVIAKMMKYIHDNNYTVIKLSDLGFNDVTNTIYVRGLSQTAQPSQTIHSLLNMNTILWQHCKVPFTVSGKLTDTISGNGIANQPVYFTGNGATSLLPTITKQDGTFSQTGLSPDYRIFSSKGFSTNGFQVNAVFLGNDNMTSSVSIKSYGTLATTGVC
jgi:peptidoglycan/xylan/chitin deacetylase (PgdA/CDA1 family)